MHRVKRDFYPTAQEPVSMITGQREALWQALNRIAPLELAGGWDNVGVLLDPPIAPLTSRRPADEKILLTIDLTERVLAEAVSLGCTVIIAYHPVIFGGVKRLTTANAQGRILLEAAHRGIGIYSPHTALDAVPGGVCDWLTLAALTPSESILPSLPRAQEWPLELSRYEALEPAGIDQDSPTGSGRRAHLVTPMSLEQIMGQLQRRLNQNLSEEQAPIYLRVVAPPDTSLTDITIQRIALCPGAGGGLFESVRDVDLLITGEMRHHDLVSRAQSGTAVILTEHSRCERGYLSHYAQHIAECTQADVLQSRCDDDPLRLYPPLT